MSAISLNIVDGIPSNIAPKESRNESNNNITIPTTADTIWLLLSEDANNPTLRVAIP